MKSELVPGKEYSGFMLDSLNEISELGCLALTLTHQATGCRVFHLYNEDKENVFSFNFRTPPFDNSGVAHILEHSVLCGSKRYPLKDPFVALLKGSMKTFLNAITFPDKTIYPAASTIEDDLYNMMAVYGDAVFFPLLQKQVFEQEGYHLEYSAPGDDKSALRVVGVVYNEMRGNYSSQESIVSEWSLRSLFPDTPYGFDSGGEPSHILTLSYADFIDFHRMYYHPSNCRIYFYGNIPTEKHLEFLESRFLKHFKKTTVNSSIPLQKPFSVPLRLQKSYPCQKGERLEAKTTITVNWALPQATDGFNVLFWEFISEILLGSSGAPLWKALVESGLGQDIYPYSGLETELRQMVFSVGLRGTEKTRARELEDLVAATLHELCEGRIEPELINAALNRVTFNNREIKGGGYPYGLRLLRRILRGWLHGVAPEETLAVNRHLKRIKELMEAGTASIGHLVRKYLLENPHRSTVVVVPDPDFTERENAGLAEYIKGVERTLTSARKRELMDSLEELKEFQQKKESAADERKIPYLKLQSLPAQVEHITGTRETLPGRIELYAHPMETNGITYIDFAFSAVGMDENLVLFVPLFTKILTKAGLPGARYDEVQRRLTSLTGGFNGELLVSTIIGGREPAEEVIFRLKLLDETLEPGLALAAGLIRQADFSDNTHLKDLLREYYNDYKASLIPQGHRYAMIRAGSRFSAAAAGKEKWDGLTQFLFAHELCSNPEAGVKRLIPELERIRRFLLASGRLKINVTTRPERVEGIRESLTGLFSDLPSTGPGNAAAGGGPMSESEADAAGVPASGAQMIESFILSTSVNFTAHVLRGAAFGTREYACEEVLGHILKTGLLWEKIRMRGGAYGAYSSPLGFDELFCFASYRDPNLSATLTAYRQALRELLAAVPGRTELDKAVIGTVSNYEIPYKPHDKGFVAFKRALLGVTDELRQKNRDYTLRINKKELQTCAENLLARFDEGNTVILTNEETLKQERKNLGRLPAAGTRLPV
jgi:Zn-dependent M16 (insulinase) family peptidase